MQFRYCLFVWLCCACAKVGPPQGGPVDKTAPQILSHHPLADGLNTTLESVVEIVFSEAMDRRRTEEAIFVSPGDPRGFSWHGRTLRIELDLRAERTYVVTVGTGARDLRGNALEQSFSLAFATGARLDQAAVRGRVYQEHAPARSAHVWAYDLANFDGALGSVKPAYQTQSGVDGQYEFLRLAPGNYRLLSFIDADKDGYPADREWVGLPARDVTVGDTLAVAEDLALVQRETAEVKLERVQALNARSLLFLFSHPIDSDSLELNIAGLPIESLRSADDARKIYVATGEQEAGRGYDIERIALRGQIIEWSEPLRGSSRRDVKPPHWKGLEAENIAPDEPLRVAFSEEVSADFSRALWAVGDSLQTPRGRWRWATPTLAEFTPEAPWEVGMWHVALHGVDWTDRAGLAVADSLIHISFEVSEAQGILRGRAVGLVGVGQVRLWSEEVGRRFSTRCDEQGYFSFASLPTGTYRLWAFEDTDGNGTWNRGALMPFVRPERIVHHPEPIDIAVGESLEPIELEFR